MIHLKFDVITCQQRIITDHGIYSNELRVIVFNRMKESFFTSFKILIVFSGNMKHLVTFLHRLYILNLKLIGWVLLRIYMQPR